MATNMILVIKSVDSSRQIQYCAVKIWPFSTYGHADHPPPLKSGGLKKWLWKVRSVLNRTGKIIKIGSDSDEMIQLFVELKFI